MRSPFDLSGKVALVTGAARGIGLSTALALHAAGAHVYFGVRSENVELAEMIKGLSGRGEQLLMDVSDPDSISHGVETLLNRSGRIDILVNNAGIVRDGLMVRMKDEDFLSVIETNLVGPFRLMRHVLRPMMKERSGRIISISSVVGTTGNPGQANYAASKGGLVAMSKSVALEVASRGITVNVVAPGFTETDMTRELPDKVREGALSRIPAGRFGLSSEVAAAVVYLASAEAGYVTGQTIHVNGGIALV
jgi:3-oxoacyl-[acyl-carrier protein] reductase